MTAALAIGVGASTSALAAMVEFSGTDSGGRSAYASFENISGGVKVVLKNLGTQPTGHYDGTFALTGLFFNYNGTLSVAGGSASVGAGGGTIGAYAAGTSIGSYWAYGTGLNATTPWGATKGLLGAGLGVGAPANGNLGPNPQSLDGLHGAILGWNNATGMSGAKYPMVYNSIEFILTGNVAPLQASQFSDVSFQYGTDLKEPNIPAVPEPSTYVAGALMLLPFGAGMMRKLRANRTA